MKTKSTQRIVGEIVTLIQNILITIGMIFFILNLFITESLFKGALFNDLLNEVGYDWSMFADYKLIIIGLLLIVIISNWLLRELALLTSSKGVIIFILIINIFNLIGLIGYSFILYDNIVLTEKGLKPSEINNRNSGATIFLITLMITVFIFGVVCFSSKNVSYENEYRTLKPSEWYDENNHKDNTTSTEITTNQSIKEDEQVTSSEVNNNITEGNIDIRADYEKISEESIGLLEKQLGFFRYYDLLITTLRGYDTSNVYNAKIVYEISDELLNGLYQMYSSQLSDEYLKTFVSNQVRWVEEKEQYELNNNDDELHKYKHLINITLNKCSEWVSYYNGM